MRTDWSPLQRAPVLPILLVLAIAFVVMVASGKPRTGKPPSRQEKSVLYVGDSLSVGKFGEVLRDYLVANFDARNVAVYASCGSSPEHWLRAEPIFFTRCGYREDAAGRSVVVDSATHHATPKLEDLVARHRPATVIVQLGTNWMDRIAAGDTPQKEAELSSVLDRFTAALRSQSRVRIIWITPPDSSHFSQRVQRTVASLIRSAANRDHFDIIDSKELTRYIPGKTGSDGVHYNKEASTEWASRVVRRLKYRFGWEGTAY
jgi:lysophospholipase L1-like esterase